MAKPYLLISTAILIFLVSDPPQVHAQAFTKNSTSFSAGYGFYSFKNSVNNLFDLYGDVSSQSQFGPVYIKAERGLSDFFGLGISFAYEESTWGLSYFDYSGSGTPVEYTDKHSRTCYSIMGRINLHIANSIGSKKADPYVGLGLGYRDVAWKTSTNNPNGVQTEDFEFPFLGHTAFEFTLGLRYLLTPNLEAYAEVGLAKSLAQVGVALYLPGKPPVEKQLIHP